MLRRTPRCTAEVQDTSARRKQVGVWLDGHPGQDLSGGRGQPFGGQIVDLVQIVELGSQQHLRLVVEGAVLEIHVAEVQVIEVAKVQVVEVVEVAEAVEREDFGDFVAVVLEPAFTGLTSCSCSGARAGETVLGQPEMSSDRDHNVIWTLRRYPLTDGAGNPGAKIRPDCDLDHVMD